MTRQGIVLAILCAIVGAAVAVLLMGRGRDTGADQVSELQRRLDAMENRAAVAQASSRVQATPEPRDQAAIPPAARDRADAPPDSRSNALPDGEAVPAFADTAAAAERRRYEAGVFERTLAAEQIDVAASNTFAQGLTQAFGAAQELAGNQLIDAQCRVSLCRIAVLQRGIDDVESFLSSVGSLPGLENTDTYWQRELNADGSSVMTMYVARKGHPLPDYRMQTPDSLANRGDGS